MSVRTIVASLVALLPATWPASAAGQVAAWTVQPEPSVSIGSIDGADGEILLNPVAATVLSDGRIVIRNSTRGTFELRYFDRQGRHQHTASRWGRGPYEFEFPLGVHRLDGDTVLVVGEDDRFAVFGPSGGRIREGRMGVLSRLPFLVSHAIDAEHLAFIKPVPAAGPESGSSRGETEIFVYSWVGEELDSVGGPPGREAYYEPVDGGVAIYPVPFGRSGHVAAGGGMLWVGDDDKPAIRGFRPGGDDPAVEIAIPFERRPVSSSDRSRMRKAYASSFAGAVQARWARHARSMEFPEQMPWFGSLKADRLGNLWIQEYEPPWSQGPQRWVVFSPEGLQIADVSVPESALPGCSRRVPFPCLATDGVFEIGTDYVLVRQEDEWGVRYVRKYEIVKS